MRNFSLLPEDWKRMASNNLQVTQGRQQNFKMRISWRFNHFKKTLFQILVTLPVTSSTVERGFSALDRLKTYIRNTMGDERLNGLALLHIHRDIKVDIEEVITNFAKCNRKLKFV